MEELGKQSHEIKYFRQHCNRNGSPMNKNVYDLFFIYMGNNTSTYSSV
jgi:hypothetical protein